MANERTSGLSLALATNSKDMRGWRFSLRESIFWFLAMVVDRCGFRHQGSC